MEQALPSQAPITIYLNSNSSSSTNSSNNELCFVFEKPLKKEVDDLVYGSLQTFQGFNTFPTISQSQNNNICKVVNRMYNAVTQSYFNLTVRIVIPDDHYDSTTIMSYLNTNCQYQTQVFDANWTSNASGEAWLYLGLGFDGSNNAGSAIPIQGFVTDSLDNGKTWLQCGITKYSNAYIKTYESGGSITTDPYVYSGVYLIDDAETHLFMVTMGFATLNVQSPPITSGINGYGYTFPVTAAPTASTTVISPYVINLSGVTLLYVSVEGLSNNSRHSDVSMDRLSIMGAVPVSVFYGEYINYQLQNNSMQLLDDLNTMSFIVTIYDQNKNIVDFRGSNWTAELVITIKSNSRILKMHELNPGATNPMQLNQQSRTLPPNSLLPRIRPTPQNPARAIMNMGTNDYSSYDYSSYDVDENPLDSSLLSTKRSRVNYK